MRVSGEIDVEMKDWKGAAISHSNLSDLELTLGDVAEAVRDAETAVIYADRSEDEFQKMTKSTRLGNALNQAGGP